MKEGQFRRWLLEDYGLQENAVNSRVSNVATIEKYYGDVDALIAAGRVEDLIRDLSYSTSDERNNRQPAHKIPINGNIRTGSATLKQALNRYLEFYKETENSSTENKTKLEVSYDQLGDCLCQFKPVKRKKSYTRKEVKDYIQMPLLHHLQKEMPSVEWSAEYRPTLNAKDSIDIYGRIDDENCVFIEIDTVRPDQVCKKFVSRQALSDDFNSIYVVLTYSNDTTNKDAWEKELKKYKNYLSTLTSLLANASNLEKHICFHSL